MDKVEEAYTLFRSIILRKEQYIHYQIQAELCLALGPVALHFEIIDYFTFLPSLNKRFKMANKQNWKKIYIDIEKEMVKQLPFKLSEIDSKNLADFLENHLKRSDSYYKIWYRITHNITTPQDLDISHN